MCMMKRTLFVTVCSLAAAGGMCVCQMSQAEESLEEYFDRSNGVYSVFEAARDGRTEVLQARLAEGHAANGKNEQGDTPLHLATAAGHTETVLYLLKAGADPLAVNARGLIPSQVAATPDCAQACHTYEERRRKEIALFPHVGIDDDATVQRALQQGLNPNALSEDCSLTLLAAAIQAGAEKTARLLLASGANASYTLPNGQSLLHLAAREGRAQMIRLLLQAGADPMARSGNGAVALHEAIWHARTDAALELIPAYKAQGYNPDGKGNGYPIRMAIWRGNARVVQALLDAGLNPNDNAFRDMPLLVQAVQANRADMAAMLLKAGADKTARDNNGKSAADYATGSMVDLLK